MRVDKYLKVSRLIKRRSVANQVCTAGRVTINGKQAKPGSDVGEGDILSVRFGNGTTKVRILAVRETVRKEEAPGMYEVLEEPGSAD